MHLHDLIRRDRRQPVDHRAAVIPDLHQADLKMRATTQAAVLMETGRPLRLLEVEIPPLKPGQVLVDVAYSGVCHSQLNEVRGLKGPDRFLPHALGHEGSGTVVAVAEGVAKV